MLTGRGTLVLAACLALTAASCGGRRHADKVGGERAAKALVLTMASGNGNPGDLDAFTHAVERLSAGAMRVRIAASWRAREVGYEQGLIRDVQAGKADLGWVGSRAWDAVGVHDFDALHAPLLIDNYTLEQAVVEGPLPARMFRELRPLGLHGLGILPGPMRRLAGAKPLRGPGDLAGLRVGIQESRVATVTLAAIGATGVPMPSGTAVRGLDAVEQQIAAMVSNRFNEEHPYVTANVALWPRPLVLFAGPRALGRLSKPQLALLERAARAAIAPDTTQVRGDDVYGQSGLCAAGATLITASPSDLAAFRRAFAPVYAELERDAATAAAIRAIEELKRRTGAPADVVPACERADAAPARATPVDGLYTFTLTKADLNELFAQAEDRVAENRGRFRFALTRGSIAYTQENAEACTWFYGRYTVKGDALDIHWVPRGGGIAPNDALAIPPEVVYRWTRYRDLMKLSPIEPHDTAMFYRHAWRRIGSNPALADLSHRCPPPRKALPR